MMSDRCRRLWSISTFTNTGGGLLQFCSVRKNRLSGSVDLPDHQPPNCRQYAEWPYRYHKLARKAALPERLRPFSLSYNQLNGPIDLTRLPQSMVELWLHEHAMWKSVGFYGGFPPSIQSIKLAADTKRKKQIGALRGLFPQSPASVRKRFEAFPWKKICQE
ncbi:hypothetical protein XU18_2705 [Perkinsela sp. CCAP 1560/4]|nr:hypothetical protein XU18_2705 [Perkinsela sp. CCAP 1560/4]|eukprot:KNH06423.1 hypothetical protein XU18_2705 [Perkinsela sp. CCAP 1560/4]